MSLLSLCCLAALASAVDVPAQAPPPPSPRYVPAGAAPAALPPPPPPPPLLHLPPPRYGDQGTSELALGLGYSSQSGFLAAGGYRYFVLDGVAPGVEATYLEGASWSHRWGSSWGPCGWFPCARAARPWC